MAYGDNRNSVATDDFSTDPFAARWVNGDGDWNTFDWIGSDYIQPTATSVVDGMRRNNGEEFTADHYSTITFQLAIPVSTITYVGSNVRMASGTDESAYGGDANENVNDHRILEHDAAFGETILANGGGAVDLNAGDTLTTEVEGTTIRIGTNEGSGDTQRLSTTDATIADGEPGILMYVENPISNGQVDAWEGGSIGIIVSGIGARLSNFAEQPMLRGPF
jgi:hypothetical protein